MSENSGSAESQVDSTAAKPQAASTSESEAKDRQLSARRNRGLQGAFVFAYVFCVLLVGYGIYNGGIWVILSNTRVLDTLIDAGIIAYTDQQMGLIDGLPDLGLYFLSQEPIHWQVLGFVAVLYTAFYLLKMVQFHSIARFYGLKGSIGAHARAFFYGQGIGRILPYGGGDLAVISALEGQGEDARSSSSVVFVQDLFVWFEIITFFIVGILLTGWEMSFLQALWPVVFFAILWYATRGIRHDPVRAEKFDSKDARKRIVAALATQPALLIRLCLLSLVCFFFDDLTPYLTSQALSSGELILHVPFLVVQGGVVGGYIASRIPITPGGIGQFEFGFGMALMMAGTGFGTSMTIILVDGVFRHGVPLAMFAFTRIWHGIETSLPRVLDHFVQSKPATVTD